MHAPSRQFTWHAPSGGLSPDDGETSLVRFSLDHEAAQRELEEGRRIGLPVEARILYFDLPCRLRGTLCAAPVGPEGSQAWRFRGDVEVAIVPGAHDPMMDDERESIEAGIADAIERGQPAAFLDVIDAFAAECGLRATDRVDRWKDQLAGLALEP